MTSDLDSRSLSDRRAFREAFWLLVAFGVSSLPATLLMGIMGVDLLEGDAGPAGTLAMALAGSVSLVCVVVGVAARRRWAAGRPLRSVLAIMSWPLLAVLAALCVSLLAYTAEFSFLLGGQ